MFAQVACLKCGKPFQVKRETLGQPTTCPWCNETTQAVPTVMDVQPLPPATDLLPAARKPRRKLLLYLAYAALLLLIAAGVFVGVRTFTAPLPGLSLAEWTAPDGSCKATLPGTVSETAIDPPLRTLPNGKRFRSASWMTKAVGEVGWFELTEEDATYRPVDLLNTVREGRAALLEAKVDDVNGVDDTSDVTVKYTAGAVRYVERQVVVKRGKRGRVYFVCVGGPNLSADNPEAKRVLESLTITP